MMYNKTYRIQGLLIILVLLTLTGCMDPGRRFLEKGRHLLTRGLPDDAGLMFAEGYDYYEARQEPAGMLACRVYREICGLRKGNFRNEIRNLERCSVDFTLLKTADPELQLQIKLQLARAYLYAFETEKAATQLEEAAVVIDDFLKQHKSGKLSQIKKELGSRIQDYLVYTALANAQQAEAEPLFSQTAGYADYCPLADVPGSLDRLGELENPAQAATFLNELMALRPLQPDLVWLAALSVYHSRQLSPEKKLAYLQPIREYFHTAVISCLAGYTAYHLARCAETADADTAILNYQAALPVMQQLGKEDFYMNSLAGLAILYYRRGNYALAGDYFRTVLPLYGKSGDRKNTADCRNYLASLYKALGNLLAAEKEFLDVLALYQELGDRGKIASVYNNLGVIYKDQLQYDRAFAYFNRGIALVEEMLSRETDTQRLRELYIEKYIKVNNLAEILISRQLYNQALERYLLNLRQELREKNLGGTAIDATVAMNYAACRYFLIREDPFLSPVMCNEILLLLTTAADQFAKLGEYVKVNEIKYLQGQIYFNTGAYSEAEAVYLELADFFSASKNVSHLAGVCYSLFLTEKQLDEEEAATRNLMKSVENYDYYIRLIPSLEGQNQIYEKYLPYFKVLIDRLVAAGQPKAAFNYSEMMKARILLQQMQLRQLDPLITVPPDLKNRLKELSLRESTLIKEFERNWWFAGLLNDYTYADEIREKLAEIDEERKRIYSAIRVTNAHVADLNQAYAAACEEVQGCLQPDQLIVNYIFADTGFYAFLIDRDTVEVVTLGGAGFNRAALRQQIVRFRDKLQALDKDPAAESRALYDLLLDPLADRLGQYAHIIIVPTDELFYIPFDALIDRHTGKYLIDSYNGIVTYAISCSVYLNLLKKPVPAYSMDYYGLGDPDYQGRVPQLIYTGRELDEVQALFGSRGRIFKRIYASESRVKESDLTFYRYLHFSCHGMNYGNSGFLSFPALLLAAGPGDPDDGYLKHDEVSTLRIPAQLVLLSACQTGLGKVVEGDGLVGLNQAFFIAGAGTVISSLWSVSDRYTMLLVTDFFRRLQAGGTLAGALKKAMLTTKALELSEYGTTHPFFWAPFVVMGKGE